MTTDYTSDEVTFKRVDPRYIMINEDVYDALSRDERDVYIALRFESDYSKESSSVNRTVTFLVNKSKVSRRQVFRCLNSLETIHYIIQREQTTIAGIQNTYKVSRTLNYFNPNRFDSFLPDTRATQAHVDKNCTNLEVTRATQAHPRATQAYHIINTSLKDLKTLPDSNESGKQKSSISKTKDYTKDTRFMKFYNAYPKKVDPQDAWKAFKNIVGNDDELLDEILKDLEERKARHTQWQDKQFIKYPAVYLRKGEYLGEIINIGPQTKGKSEQSVARREESQPVVAFKKLSEDDKVFIQDYQHRLKYPDRYVGVKSLSESDYNRANDIFARMNHAGGSQG